MNVSNIYLQVQNRPLPERLSQLFVIIAGGSAALLLVVYTILAVQWQLQPYLGVMLSPEMVVTNPYSLMIEPSPADEVGLQFGDRLIAVGGQELTGTYRMQAQQMNAILAGYSAGDRIRVRFLRAADEPGAANGSMQCVVEGGQQLCAAIFPLTIFPWVDFLIQFGVSWLCAVGGMVLGVSILRWRWQQAMARQVALASFLLAIIAMGVFDLYTTRVLSPLVYVNTLVLLGGMSVVFLLSFPYDMFFVQRYGWAKFLPVGVTVIGLLIGNGLLVRLESFTPALLFSVAFVGAGWIGLIIGVTQRLNHAASPVVRDQCAIVLVVMLLAVTPMLVWMLSASMDLVILGQLFGFHLSLVTPFLFLLPAGMTYSLAQDVLPQSDTLISRSIVYAIMAVGIVFGYALLVAGVSLLTGSVIKASNPLVIALTVFLVALLFVPVRNRLESQVNTSYFRMHRLYQNQVESLAQDLTHATDLDGIVVAMRKRLNDTLTPTHIFLFFPGSEGGRYTAYGTPLPETDIYFQPNSPLLDLLERQQRPLYLEMGRNLPAELAVERSRVAVLGTPIFVPLRGRVRLSGVLAIGPRLVEERYHYDDLSFIQAMADQAALAVERAQVIANLEQRVQEMNVLGQVAQAVNYTIEFDDLLELIYAQTNRVFNAPNFYIVLRDPHADELYYAFYSEENERFFDKEGVRWRVGRDLLSDIARGGQPIRVENYGLEVTRRGVQSDLDNMNLKNWMGVPLSAPGGVMGVLAVGSSSLNVMFGDEQLKILWQIADQAAIALDKARLFQETEVRARQLTALNEISTQLATVLQDSERLLELITQSAVRILEADAGSLLMIDPETHELEFKVAIGADTEGLLGTRLEPGTGLVGTVADRGEPLIVNDTNRDPRWYSGVDDEVGTNTTTVIAAPLRGGGGIIGVLEVLNKRDGGVFVEDDKRLLVTFAGQAAIAIENARLFQMTDQQLAARVDELDTMQKIDRELNETLKLQRVLDITLDWALRESGATVGALGMVVSEPPGVRIMAHYGYPIDSFANGGIWPLSHGVVGRVVRSGQPELVDVTLDHDYVETMPGVQAQLTVPLFTSGEVSGVIVLESVEANAFNILDIDFVSRLAEHASPAMANAGLVDQLEQANDARTEFVSFVAHELRTPMTSLKGYADLLFAGVVGPVNDQQKNFLSTILNNVDRMSTLVSDLNDLTKLQTERMSIEQSVINFQDVVEQTLRPLQNQIDNKGQVVTLQLTSNLPEIYADRNRLIQILTNLLTNAHKYTPADGEIIVAARKAQNEWDPDGVREVLHIQVQDNGLGISEEDLAALFQPYFRSTNRDALDQPGTGLGLVIVQGLVEQHGGRIWVESELGQGSTFHLTMPLVSAVPAARELLQT